MSYYLGQILDLIRLGNVLAPSTQLSFLIWVLGDSIDAGQWTPPAVNSANKYYHGSRHLPRQTLKFYLADDGKSALASRLTTKILPGLIDPLHIVADALTILQRDNLVPESLVRRIRAMPLITTADAGRAMAEILVAAMHAAFWRQ